MIDWLICCWYWDNNKLEADCARKPLSYSLYKAIKSRNPNKKRRHSDRQTIISPSTLAKALNMATDHMPAKILILRQLQSYRDVSMEAGKSIKREN